MMRCAIPGMLLCLCAAMPAFAADLELSAGGEVEYDDNVFRRDRDKEDDVLFRLRPGVRVFEDHGDDLNFSVGYHPPVELSVEHSHDLNDVDHFFSGNFTYHASDRVEVYGRDNYGYLRSTFLESGGSTDVTTGAFVPNISNERDRVNLNDATLGALYNFTPRMVGRFEASSDYFDSTRDDRSRVWSAGATADTTYRLSLKHQIGGGLGYTRQDFSDREDLITGSETFAGSETDVYNLFGTWRWLIDETLNFEVSAGPSYLETRQDAPDAARGAFAVPFFFLGPGQLSGTFLDENGALLSNPTIGAGGGLLVPLIGNCGTVDGTPVASRCAPSTGEVVLDAFEDEAAFNAILSNPVVVIHDAPRSGRDSNVTIFANVTLSKRWSPTLATAVRYSRQQGNASGLGGTVIADAVSLSNTWDFWQRWQLNLRGDWTRRVNAFDIEETFDRVSSQQAIPGGTVFVAARDGTAFNSRRPADIDTDRWGVAARITHQLFRTTSVYVQVRYDEQSSDRGTLGSTSDFENFLATFGVRHVFEPIKLW